MLVNQLSLYMNFVRLVTDIPATTGASFGEYYYYYYFLHTHMLFISKRGVISTIFSQ